MNISVLPIFPLLLPADMRKCRLRGSVRSQEDDDFRMSVSRTTYFWFYFSPPGRGVGGGV